MHPVPREPRSAGALDPLVEALGRLSSLGEEERQAILGLEHEVRELPKRTRLVSAGEAPEHCWLLLTAFAHKVKYSGGSARVVALNLPGEIVNVETMLALESDYSAEVLRAGRAALIPAAALRDLAFSRPVIARALWLRTQSEAAIYREWLLNDGRRDVRTRTAHLIAETAARLEVLNAAPGAEPILPLDPAEVAQALGAAPFYVERALGSLAADGAIAFDGVGVRIADFTRLAEAGAFDPRYLLDRHRQD